MKKTIVLLCILQQIGVVGCYAGGGISKTNTETEHLLSSGSSQTHRPKTLPPNANPGEYSRDFEEAFNNAAGTGFSHPVFNSVIRQQGYLDLRQKFEGVDQLRP